jgi:hypothetical protein
VYIIFVEKNLDNFMDDEIHMSLVGSHAPHVFSFLDKDIRICRRRHGWKHEEFERSKEDFTHEKV